MDWSPPPPPPDLDLKALDAIVMQPSSATSSVIDSASITNNSTSATSISTTPERTTATTEEKVNEERILNHMSLETRVEEEVEIEQTEMVEGGDKEEGGEGSEKEDEPEGANEGEEEPEQTRNTRILRDRARPQNTPITPSTKKSVTTVKGVTTITRQLRSSAKAPSSAPTSKTADKTRRQSKRLSIIATSKHAETPTGARGKRSYDIMAAGSRSANAKLQGNGSKSTAYEAPLRASKRTKKHFSYNEDDDDEDSTTRDASEAPSTDSQSKQKKKKVWLNQGLYLGQGQDLDVRKRPGGKAKKRGKAGVDRPAALPLPMFTGLGIMNTTRHFKLPFNIFAPSPWKCGPIQDWRKLNHNVLIGDASQVWKKEKASMAKCVCTEKKGCDEDCLNRCTWMECDEGNCNVEPQYCSNRAFADLKERVKTGTKFAEGVEVILTQNCGHGLRATRSFAPRQIVVEYTGEIITQEESERRMIEDYKDNNNYYLMLFHQNMILDATRGSVARFVNHSCDPNCRMEKWLVDGKPRMALFAGDKGIEAGDELTYDYNFNWFTGVSQQACHCGAENCRGALGKRADGLQKKPDQPLAKGKGKGKGKLKKKGVNGKGGKLADKKKPTRGRPRKVVAQVQKSVIISPKRRHQRKPPPSPLVSPSPTPEDSPEPESPSSSSETSDHPTEASPSTIKNASSLSEAARRRRTHDKAGRPRVTKTYKVNKTIRGGKGKVLHKSVTSKKAVSILKKKTYEKVLAATTTTTKSQTPSVLSSSSSSVSSNFLGAVATRVTRRSLAAISVDDEVSNQLLEQAITTVLSAATGIDGLSTDREPSIRAAPVLNTVQVAS